MATTWVSFKQIKADVAIEQVLERYGVHLRRVGGELRGSCPLPTHTSRRSRDSFSVSPARNAWSCRSQSCMEARDGKTGGNILDCVASMWSKKCCYLAQHILSIGNKDIVIRASQLHNTSVGHGFSKSTPLRLGRGLPDLENLVKDPPRLWLASLVPSPVTRDQLHWSLRNCVDGQDRCSDRGVIRTLNRFCKCSEYSIRGYRPKKSPVRSEHPSGPNLRFRHQDACTSCHNGTYLFGRGQLRRCRFGHRRELRKR
jgi:hypothetical protein